MKIQKKYIAVAVIALLVIVNSLATMRLFFGVMYPERLLKGAVNEYFRNNLNKAVKFEDLYIDYDGTIVLDDLNVSITSDFNDNISLIKSEKAVINLRFFALCAGSISVEGIDFYNSEIIFIKKFGRSHVDSFLMVFDPGKFIKKTQESYGDFYIDFHRAKLFYRESLRAKQVIMELYKINAGMTIDKNYFTYDVSGKIKKYHSNMIRNGDFDCRGTIRVVDYNYYHHDISVNNFDLTYLNDHILDYKVADIALKGGLSTDFSVSKKKNMLSVSGKVETNALTVFSIPEKFNLLSNENMNIAFDMSIDPDLNSYAIRQLKLDDDVLAIEGSGRFARNDKEDVISLNIKSNKIDLGDLSQNLSPLKNIEYGGTLKFDGSANLDFKNSKASGIKGAAVLEDFTLSKNVKGSLVPIVEESSASLSFDESSISLDIKGKPLKSDLSVACRSKIASWIPFRSETAVSVRSQKMNLDNLHHCVVYFADKVFAAAYEDKRNPLDKEPFMQRPLGKFLNYNTISLKSSFDTMFYGAKARFSDVVMNAQLTKGSILLNDFSIDGYDAKYRLSFQGYFNSDQPYVKLEGKVEDFDLSGFYSDSGIKGSLSAKARTEFSFEVSAARMGDILDNAKGHFNIYIGKGEMKNTPLQHNLIAFLRKNGYDPGAISDISFEDITLSVSEQGENFWFSNLGIRGDTMQFNALGDYLYEGGISSTPNLTIRNETSSTSVPIKLSGPLLAPCLDVSGKSKSHRVCF
ncbi:MAG: hypothetical protein KA369_07620 [Spirochaetes bacterium]|nr:hypothetical protein [Spirochaetota bacterium]